MPVSDTYKSEFAGKGRTMRIRIILVTFLVTISCRWISASNNTETTVLQKNSGVMVGELLRRGLSNLWTWIQNRGKTEDNFVGRCFGVARKLKMMIPVIIFKLGVIVTTLAFLTIFALKSLGLLGLLVVMNSSAFVAKLTHLKKDDDSHQKWSPPQNVHFHIHQNKDGHYSVGHSEPSSYDHDGWYDRGSLEYAGGESLTERLKKLNIYDSYRR